MATDTRTLIERFMAERYYNPEKWLRELADWADGKEHRTSTSDVERFREIADLLAALPQAQEGCTIPPPGWVCTRAAGHDGPCAAMPLDEAELRRKLAEEERAHLQTIDERDAAEEWADKLAYAVASEDEIGEHSNLNNPWANALEILEKPAAAPPAPDARLRGYAQRSEWEHPIDAALREMDEVLGGACHARALRELMEFAVHKSDCEHERESPWTSPRGGLAWRWTDDLVLETNAEGDDKTTRPIVCTCGLAELEASLRAHEPEGVCIAETVCANCGQIVCKPGCDGVNPIGGDY